MDRLLVHVRDVLGRDPSDGGAYVFHNRAASCTELLFCDTQRTCLRYVVCSKRGSFGRAQASRFGR